MIQFIFAIIFIVAAGSIAFVFAMMFNPKLNAKFLSKQVKAQKYMMDESKEDLKSITDNMAYATKDGIKTTVRAIKEGFTNETIYCKHCGSEIDSDSKFCKKCGKEQ